MEKRRETKQSQENTDGEVAKKCKPVGPIDRVRVEGNNKKRDNGGTKNGDIFHLSLFEIFCRARRPSGKMSG